MRTHVSPAVPSDEYGIPGGRRNDFQQGGISWNASNGALVVGRSERLPGATAPVATTLATVETLPVTITTDAAAQATKRSNTGTS
ncbi:hypothetical protein [Amycolatopsis circi]|uniref:hypothetical protein n=1 Tax=Amycolatopsis circi TaxID=871959 RepID=UPI000E288CD3